MEGVHTSFSQHGQLTAACFLFPFMVTYFMEYTVTIRKSALKDIKKAPARIQRKF